MRIMDGGAGSDKAAALPVTAKCKKDGRKCMGTSVDFQPPGDGENTLKESTLAWIKDHREIFDILLKKQEWIATFVSCSGRGN